jgi:hypothetical protein
MPVFPAVDGVPVVVARRDPAPSRPVEVGSMAAIVAGRRCSAPEA